ncbi:hypothetical protein FGIG_04834 [Fasciola gigantica]|uniref:non-specific serine/threonine protein kinase n=1 Tax=Fasciola gigantica TaxID=46835 RepID=A0A504YIA9_FASGI|nr:hypothetical protein FGIG_04834 [Fasciola gigantica]
MARLRHRNVVQYVTSWVEYGSGPLADIDRGEAYYSSDPQNLSLEDGSKSITSDGDDLPSVISPVQFGGNSEENCPDTLVNNRSLLSVCNGISANEELQIAPFRPKSSERCSFGPRLFIQLELCNYNLAQWLQHRNEEFDQRARSSGPLIGPKWWQTVPHAPGRWLADQLACGLAYLHANGMMHRDLKPENVLLSGPPLSSLCDQPCACQPTCCSPTRETGDSQPQPSIECYHRLIVKICDFGLSRFLDRPCKTVFPTIPTGRMLPSARPVPDMKRNTHSSRAVSLCSGPTQRSPARPPERRAHSHSFANLRFLSESKKDGSTESLDSLPIFDSRLTENPHLPPPPQLLTGHLGSELYAAPEVRPPTNYRRRVFYDYKADVYSLGVIFFQLFYPFSTSHELITCLQGMVTPQKPPILRCGGQRKRPSKSPPSDSSTSRATGHVILPSSFVFSWPEESQLVGRMLQHDPTKRPSANELQYFLAPTSEYPDLIPFRTSNCTVNSTLTDPVAAEVQEDSRAVIETKHCSVDFQQLLTGGSHRLLDMALWRCQELERELIELRQRLTHSKPDVHTTPVEISAHLPASISDVAIVAGF